VVAIQTPMQQLELVREANIFDILEGSLPWRGGQTRRLVHRPGLIRGLQAAGLSPQWPP
jgi:hypothetical protein